MDPKMVDLGEKGRHSDKVQLQTWALSRESGSGVLCLITWERISPLLTLTGLNESWCPIKLRCQKSGYDAEKELEDPQSQDWQDGSGLLQGTGQVCQGLPAKDQRGPIPLGLNTWI